MPSGTSIYDIDKNYNFDLMRDRPVNGDTPKEQRQVLKGVIMPPALQTDITYHPKQWEPANITETLSQPVFWPKFQLYSSMEVHWLRILRNMGYIKDSVSSQKFQLRIDNDVEDTTDAEAKKFIIEQSLKMMKGDNVFNINTFDQLVNDILQCYGYGISVQELLYKETEDGLLLPYGSQVVSGQAYDYNLGLQKLYLKFDGGDFYPGKFLVSTYRNRSTTNMSTFGVYQALVWWASAHIYARDYFWKLAERYGTPFVVGKYPSSFSQADATAFANMLSKLGDSGWLTGPNTNINGEPGIDVQFLESSINGTNSAQAALLEYCDKQADLIILGQTLTSEATSGGAGSRALGEVHERVMNKIISNLSRLVLQVLNNQFIPSILIANNLSVDNCPQFYIQEKADLAEVEKKIKINQLIESSGYKDINFIDDMKQFGYELEKSVVIPTDSTSNTVISPKNAIENKE